MKFEIEVRIKERGKAWRSAKGRCEANSLPELWEGEAGGDVMGEIHERLPKPDPQRVSEYAIHVRVL